LTKTQLLYSVSFFNFGGWGLGALFKGDKSPKDPRGEGTVLKQDMNCLNISPDEM